MCWNNVKIREITILFRAVAVDTTLSLHSRTGAPQACAVWSLESLSFSWLLFICSLLLARVCPRLAVPVLCFFSSVSLFAGQCVHSIDQNRSRLALAVLWLYHVSESGRIRRPRPPVPARHWGGSRSVHVTTSPAVRTQIKPSCAQRASAVNPRHNEQHDM